MRLYTDNTKIGYQRGKRIVRNLRASRRHRTDKGRLASIGHAQQTHVRQHLQLQPQVTQLALGTLGSLARGAIHRGFETGVAKTMKPALGHLEALAGVGQISQDLMGIHIDHRGADRNRQNQVLAFVAGTVAAGARLAILGLVFALEPVVDQRVQRLLGFQIYGTTIAPVAAIGATLGNVFFSPEAQAAVTALAGFHNDGGFVYEFHESTLCAMRIN